MLNVIDNVVAYRPQLLPSTEVARYCTYRHISPSGGTYYGRTYGFEFTVYELNNNRWRDGEGYLDLPIMKLAIQKYPKWNEWKHEVCKTHLFNWECSFIERGGVLESKSTGHSYNDAVPLVGKGFFEQTVEIKLKKSVDFSSTGNPFYGKKHKLISKVKMLQSKVITEI